jgi:hypothetical protein
MSAGANTTEQKGCDLCGSRSNQVKATVYGFIICGDCFEDVAVARVGVRHLWSATVDGSTPALFLTKQEAVAAGEDVVEVYAVCWVEGTVQKWLPVSAIDSTPYTGCVRPQDTYSHRDNVHSVALLERARIRSVELSQAFQEFLRQAKPWRIGRQLHPEWYRFKARHGGQNPVLAERCGEDIRHYRDVMELIGSAATRLEEWEEWMLWLERFEAGQIKRESMHMLRKLWSNASGVNRQFEMSREFLLYALSSTTPRRRAA